MKRKPVKSSDRLLTKKKRRRSIDPGTKQLVLQILSGVAIFGLVTLILVGVWYGSRISNLTLKTITVEGGQTISHAQVQAAVSGTLEGSYLGLIPKRFAWTYPEESAKVAAASVGRVKNPSIERVSGTELRVVVDEYLPFALWCMESEEHKCLFIDKEGVAFAPAPVLDGGAMYRFYTLGDMPEIGKILREREILAGIVKFADELENNFDLPVSKIELDAVGDTFFQVVGGGEIKATTEQPVEKLLENLAVVLSADDFQNLEAGTFSYIDLRFGNKVFVNDVVPEIATSTEEVSIDSGVSEDAGGDILETVMEEMKRVVTDTEDEETDVVEIASGSSTTATANIEENR